MMISCNLIIAGIVTYHLLYTSIPWWSIWSLHARVCMPSLMVPRDVAHCISSLSRVPLFFAFHSFDRFIPIPIIIISCINHQTIISDRSSLVFQTFNRHCNPFIHSFRSYRHISYPYSLLHRLPISFHMSSYSASIPIRRSWWMFAMLLGFCQFVISCVYVFVHACAYSYFNIYYY